MPIPPPPVAIHNVMGKIQEVNPGDASCTFQKSLTTSGVTAALWNNTTAVGNPASVNGSTGTYTIPAASDSIFNKLCINGNIVSGGHNYALACVKSPQLTCTLGSGACAVNGTNGTFTVTPLYDNNVFNKLCINGTVASGGVNYQLACVSSPQLTCSVGSGACAINCTPNNALSAGNVSINVGFKKPAP